jgi:ATP-dependent RNA helicase DHX29
MSDRKLVHAESKASTPKPKSISALPAPTLSDSAQSGLPVQTREPSTVRPSSSTRLAGEQQVTPVSECGADLLESPEFFLDDDPNIQYARLKVELDKRTRTPSGDSEASFIEELHSHLKAVKSHYLFDKRDAEAQYISRRQKLDEAFLQARLRGFPRPGVSKPYKVPVPDAQPPHHHQNLKEVRGDSADIFDSNEQEDGGLFEILDDMPSTDISETGVTVRVRDMPLPKGKLDRTSKAFLQATVNKLDSFAVTTYHLLSGASRAKRASLSIRWSSDKFSEWTMTDVACHDIAQAEQYIATVALHALTFPVSTGFAPGTSAPGTGQTFFRLLPPAYRELWDELEAARKSSDDATNRAVWAKLKRIVETRNSLEKVRPRLFWITGATQLHRPSTRVPDRRFEISRVLLRRTLERKRPLHKSSSPLRVGAPLHHIRKCLSVGEIAHLIACAISPETVAAKEIAYRSVQKPYRGVP